MYYFAIVAGVDVMKFLFHTHIPCASVYIDEPEPLRPTNRVIVVLFDNTLEGRFFSGMQHRTIVYFSTPSTVAKQ